MDMVHRRPNVKSALECLHCQLTNGEARLRNLCEHLLEDALEFGDIEPMLGNPFGPRWQAEETNEKIRNMLLGLNDHVQQTVLAIQKELDELRKKLSIEIIHDGKVGTTKELLRVQLSEPLTNVE